MRSIIRCRDIASMTVEATNEKIKDKYRINQQKLEKFYEYCDYFDEIIEENLELAFQPATFEVDVDTNTGDIILTLICDYITVKSKDHPYLKAMAASKKCTISQHTEDLIKHRFVYPTVWEVK